MKYAFLFILVIFMSCKNEVNNTESTEVADDVNSDKVQLNQELEVYDYDGLRPLIHKEDDKIHIVNFWATWCAPCVKELPYFEFINENYKNKDVEVLLVSLDFPSKYDTNLKPFILKNALKSKVVALDDVDQNRWIPAIHKDWSGAIPATIIYNSTKRKFYEQSFTQAELESELKQFLKK